MSYVSQKNLDMIQQLAAELEATSELDAVRKALRRTAGPGYEDYGTIPLIEELDRRAKDSSAEARRERAGAKRAREDLAEVYMILKDAGGWSDGTSARAREVAEDRTHMQCRIAELETELRTLRGTRPQESTVAALRNDLAVEHEEIVRLTKVATDRYEDIQRLKRQVAAAESETQRVTKLGEGAATT